MTKLLLFTVKKNNMSKFLLFHPHHALKQTNTHLFTVTQINPGFAWMFLPSSCDLCISLRLWAHPGAVCALGGSGANRSSSLRLPGPHGYTFCYFCLYQVITAYTGLLILYIHGKSQRGKAFFLCVHMCSALQKYIPNLGNWMCVPLLSVSLNYCRAWKWEYKIQIS